MTRVEVLEKRTVLPSKLKNQMKLAKNKLKNLNSIPNLL
jgi:hypothetical protein